MDVFLELCKLSEEHKWCDNLSCTTCGNQNFKYSFFELVEGKIPNTKDWLVNKSPAPKVKRKYVDVPRFKMEEPDLITLATIIASTDLYEVHKIISDQELWLKALGVILNFICSSKEATQILSNKLIPQFSHLCNEELYIEILTVSYLSNIDRTLKYMDKPQTKSYFWYSDKIKEYLSSPDRYIIDLSIDKVTSSHFNCNKVIAFTELWIYEGGDLFDFIVNKSTSSITMYIDNIEEDEYYLDDFEDITEETINLNNLDLDVHEDVIEICLEKFRDLGHIRILEYFDEVPLLSSKFSRVLYDWAKSVEEKNLELIEQAREQATYLIHGKQRTKIKIGKSLDPEFLFENGCVLFSICASGTSLQMKGQALRKKIKSITGGDAIIYSASARGKDFEWRSSLSKCVTNISKDDAIELIRWSECEFAVWCEKDSLPRLIYPDKEGRIK
jgi:hypothetical protein